MHDFANKHPFLTFFLALAAIDGVVALVRPKTSPALPPASTVPVQVAGSLLTKLGQPRAVG